MDIRTAGASRTVVTLSVKNLMSLLAEATDHAGHAGLIRTTADGTTLVIKVEPDRDHYAARAIDPAMRGKV